MCLFSRNVEVEASEVDAVIEYMEKVAARQNGMVNPANFRAPDCPKLWAGGLVLLVHRVDVRAYINVDVCKIRIKFIIVVTLQ